MPARPVGVEIEEDDAEWLMGEELPEGVSLEELDEVEFWGQTFDRAPGSALYVPAGEEAVDRAVARHLERAAPLPPPIGIDLFAGGGGFSLGMHAGGFDVVAAVEWEVTAAQTYLVNLGRPDCKLVFVDDTARRKWDRARQLSAKRGERYLEFGSAYRASKNMPGGCRAFFLGDVRQLTGAQILEEAGVPAADVVFGGPPCQGLSTSNSKACLEDPRNAMLWEFLRLVAEIKPRAFIIENVPPLLTVAKGALFNALAKLANEAGYDVVAEKLNACSYGVPQHRLRAIVVGTLEGTPRFQFPMPSHWAIGRPVRDAGWYMGGPGQHDEEPMDEGVAPDARYDPTTRRWSVGAAPSASARRKRARRESQGNLFGGAA